MLKPNQLSIDEMILEVRRHANVRDDAVGQYSDDLCKSALYTAAIWVQSKLLTVHKYWDTKTTLPFSVTTNTIPFPDDFMWERRLLKRVSAVPEKYERVEVVKPNELEGFRQQGSDREVWTVGSAGFLYEGKGTPNGTYKLDYINRVSKVEDSTATYETIPAQYHWVIPLRAAYVVTRNAGHIPRSEALLADLKGWEEQAVLEAAALEQMRTDESSVKSYPLGSLGYLRARVRQTMSVVREKTGYLSPSKIDPYINAAARDLALHLISANEGYFIAEHKAAPVVGVFTLPPDFVNLIRFERQVGNSDSWERVEVVPLVDAFKFQGVFPRYTSDNSTIITPETWSQQHRTLRANNTAGITGNYRAIINKLPAELVAEEDVTEVPPEFMDTLADLACEYTALGLGFPEVGMSIGMNTKTKLANVKDRVSQQRNRAEIKMVRDVCGYEQDPI